MKYAVLLIALVILLVICILFSDNFYTKNQVNYNDTARLANKIIMKENKDDKYYFIVFNEDVDKVYEVTAEEFNKYDILDEYIK